MTFKSECEATAHCHAGQNNMRPSNVKYTLFLGALRIDWT